MLSISLLSHLNKKLFPDETRKRHAAAESRNSNTHQTADKRRQRNENKQEEDEEKDKDDASSSSSSSSSSNSSNDSLVSASLANLEVVLNTEFLDLVLQSTHLGPFIHAFLTNYRYLMNRREISDFLGAVLPRYLAQLGKTSIRF